MYTCLLTDAYVRLCRKKKTTVLETDSCTNGPVGLNKNPLTVVTSVAFFQLCQWYSPKIGNFFLLFIRITEAYTLR